MLRHWTRRPLLTVAQLYLALAARGGHLGHKGDGPAGWQTLWRGRRTLRLLVEGVRLAAQLPDHYNQKKRRPIGQPILSFG